MATVAALVGGTGGGKTTSIRNLNEKETFLINIDGKSPNFPGWKNKFNRNENKNYAKPNNLEMIYKALNYANEGGFKVVILDTINSLMDKEEIGRMTEDGFFKWQDMIIMINKLIDFCNMELNDDIIVYMVFHEEIIEDVYGVPQRKIKMNGKKLKAMDIEYKFTLVFFTRVSEREEGDNLYQFETKKFRSTGKTPIGMFKDFLIPNDLKLITEKIKKYEEGE